VDDRRLFIGNGTLEEGAPAVGNTEILTEYSDILGHLLISTPTKVKPLDTQCKLAPHLAHQFHKAYKADWTVMQ
jgi:hypothetical protein